ncbi:penicillin-binding protein 2 [Bernardetia litoralis DSM 6794]|uniref:Beta-lactamase n=1 Tax=Bernardetia litoralis (strain ATCC 23117 / DSM 6794 / NBRC 15988 / NCIMB 1366 / Fx l1 / Sio-4) TaxID=880071 RepID=I4AMU2_BERLS|nr:penicillin-binding protein 2 [Bernardetia litoralis]AFM05277.1 penicillin-binding protein 2 [Bernardetia litoralis DSM 6794]
MNDLRRYIIQVAILAVLLIYGFQLLWLQVISDDFQQQAQNTSTRTNILYPPRGLVYDRNGKLLVENNPVFDIEIIAREFKLEPNDTTHLCQLLRISLEEFREKLQKARYGLQRYKPYLFIKQMSVENYAKIQDELSDYEGIYPNVRTIRKYPYSSFSGGLGYVREIDQRMLAKDTADYYRRGDMLGISGIERSYEEELRGKRGVQQVMYDRLGIARGSFKDGEYDTLPEAGLSLQTTIDAELQKYGEYLMQNKIGSIVAIDPKTGEVLSMVSAPTFDPNLLTGEGTEVAKNYLMLSQDPTKPLYNRALQASYPPGSTFKIVQALIGLQDGVLDTAHTSFSCSKDLVNCHNHPSPLNIHGSIQHSCNPFYYKAFIRIIRQKRSENDKEDTRIGLDHWHDHALSFGFGRKLGIDLPYESRGLMPSTAYYDKIAERRGYGWKLGNIYSLSIGQGEMSAVPLQLANFASILANRGHYYIPHVVRSINDTTLVDIKYRTKQKTTVDKKYFPYVVDAMEDVIRAGTARRAKIEDIVVCGKTGTVQNPHGEDHSVFIGFAPKDNPKIAIAVVVENAGFGGTWAAPIASLMMEKYINDTISDKNKQYKEKRVVELNLIEQERIRLEKAAERKRERLQKKKEEKEALLMTQKKTSSTKNTDKSNMVLAEAKKEDEE